MLYEPCYRILFTGDLIFVGKACGTATDSDAATEWSSVRQVLETFPDETTL